MNLYDMLLPESPYVFYDSDHGFCINTEDVFNLIEQLQLTGHWIPCSERLPKKPDGYPNCEIRRTYFLVTLKSGCVKTLAYEFDRDEWQITGSPVIAWMPLPKSYRGEGDQDE